MAQAVRLPGPTKGECRRILGPDPNPDEVSRHNREPRQPLHHAEQRAISLLSPTPMSGPLALGTPAEAVCLAAGSTQIPLEPAMPLERHRW